MSGLTATQESPLTVLERIPGVRLTPSGRYELTISHRLLEKGRVMRNFADPDEAVAYRGRMLKVLDLGFVPEELTRQAARTVNRTGPAAKARPSVVVPVAATKIGSQSPTISDMLDQYLRADSAQIADSDRPNVQTLAKELQGRVDGIRTDWVDAWIRHLKRECRLAPGTIRKKVESLARALDWWNRQKHQNGTAPPNVLRLLPVGYSAYQDDDVGPGEERPADEKRDRRLEDGEYDEIVAVLQGKHRPDKQRPWAGDDANDFLMLFRLIVGTGMRLREAYRIRVRDVRFSLATIHVPRSKTGAARDIPMTQQIEDQLKAYIEQRARKSRDDIVFPFWEGSDSKPVLDGVSRMLSRRFSSLFDHCGCKGLTEHDLRHEATCRWMELRAADGQWMFRSEEVQIITGHQNVQMFKRYLSMRGSALAQRLRA